MAAPKIRSIEVGGKTRYRFVVDIGHDPVTGKRKQATRTFDKKKDAQAELARILNETSTGTFVQPSKIKLNTYLDGWEEGVSRDSRPNTIRNTRDALRPARERLGALSLQDITKADIERLVTWMATEGRRKGGKAGTGLSGRTIGLTLQRLKAALQTAVDEGRLVRNPAAKVKPPKYQAPERGTWSHVHVRKFLGKASTDRLHAAWRLSLYGLRRGEVLGLRWAEDIDFGSFAEPCKTHTERWCVPCYGSGSQYRPATVHVQFTRVLVEGQVVSGPPKSRKGNRELPLDAAVASALHAMKVAQAAERLAAGAGYTDSGFVVVDELGAAIYPDWFTDEFERLAKRAGLPRITLHDARGSALSLLEKAGVPISVISKWAGHSNPGFTYAKYVRAMPEDLRAGADTFGKLYKISG